MKTKRTKSEFGTLTSTTYTDKEWAALRAQSQPKKKVKPLNAEMGKRQVAALRWWMEKGLLTKAEFDEKVSAIAETVRAR